MHKNAIEITWYGHANVFIKSDFLSLPYHAPSCRAVPAPGESFVVNAG